MYVPSYDTRRDIFVASKLKFGSIHVCPIHLASVASVASWAAVQFSVPYGLLKSSILLAR